MTAPTLERQEWIARVDGEIVARGSSYAEVEQAALEQGYDDALIELVSKHGAFLL